MVWTHGHTMRGPVILVVVLAMLAACGCLQRPQPAGDYDAAEGEDERMSTPIELERKLAAGDWSAVELAGQLGQTAWPTIQKAAGLPQYRSRQIAMACAGRLGGEAAGPILSAGLGDANGNVRLAAAKALSVAPPPSAGHAIRAVLTASPELEIRGLLALAAGYLPGEPTVEILRPLSQRDDVLAERARMALAKLGDAPARQAMAADLASPEPRMRYEVLG